MKWFGKVISSLFVFIWLCYGTFIYAQPGKPKTRANAIQPKTNPAKTITKKTNTVAPKPKSIILKKDSLVKPVPLSNDTSNIALLHAKDTVNVSAWPVYTVLTAPIKEDKWFINKPLTKTNTDYLFYLLAAIILLLGTIRYLFPKYFGDLFGLFFKVTFRQKAVRERLLENSIPSMLMNGLFICSGGLFLLFISQYYHWSLQQSFWYNLSFWILLLAIVYGFKLILLRAMGWLFQMPETSNTYSFIVFMVNKVTGVLLIPFVVLMAFGPVSLRPVLVPTALFLLVGMFFYRYLISYPSIRSSLRLNQFHFFLYLCAFEIVPLLLIYKGLAVHFSKAT